MIKNIKVKISGSKKDGYVLTLINKKDEFIWDTALTYEEIEVLLKEFKKIVK